eukprot:6474286-Amphidinium_carterae.1
MGPGSHLTEPHSVQHGCEPSAMLSPVEEEEEEEEEEEDKISQLTCGRLSQTFALPPPPQCHLSCETVKECKRHLSPSRLRDEYYK